MKSLETRTRKLKLERLRQNKTQTQLARETGVKAGMIGWIESGRFIPYEIHLVKIADALGVDDPEWLLEPWEEV